MTETLSEQLADYRAGWRARGAGDLAGEIEVEKKILAEGFFRAQIERRNHLSQRRQIVGHIFLSRALTEPVATLPLATTLFLRALTPPPDGRPFRPPS